MRTIDDHELPRTPRVGDRIKLREEKVNDYREACRLAGWSDAKVTAIKTVIREDNFCPGGGHRLFFDGPPFCYASPDVELAWNSVNERREALRKAGHKV